MENTKLMFGIDKEWEGDSTLWFSLDEPQKLVDYVRDNIDENVKHEFVLKKMTAQEIAELE